jgi:hypothetical protein
VKLEQLDPTEYFTRLGDAMLTAPGRVTTAVNTAKEYTVIKTPLLFAFPELVVNPTKWVWYPWLLFFTRLWGYSLFFHHLQEIKSFMDILPFWK